jgi:predicted nucleic acid-binding protein
LDWSALFNYAVDLSKKHSATVGARSLDILHIASALAVKAEKFLTVDGRQTEVAKLAGLKIVDIFR